jgi:hypothetical protein
LTYRRFSNPHLFVFIERGFIVAPVIELGGARRGMVRHLLRLFQRPVALEVIGDAGGAQAVDFKHGVISRCCKLLTLFSEPYPDIFENPHLLDKNSPRFQYMNHTLTLTLMFIELSAEAWLDKAYKQGLAPDNYTPGSLPRSIRIE